MIIVVWNKSFVAVEVKFAVWIDHLLAEHLLFHSVPLGNSTLITT